MFGFIVARQLGDPYAVAFVVALVMVSAMKMRVVYHGRHEQKDEPFGYYADLVEMAKAVDWLVAIQNVRGAGGAFDSAMAVIIRGEPVLSPQGCHLPEPALPSQRWAASLQIKAPPSRVPT